MLDSDVTAAAIAAMLRANEIEFKFKGTGRSLKEGSGKLAWDYVTVTAIHPVTNQEHALTSFRQAAIFLQSLEKKR